MLEDRLLLLTDALEDALTRRDWPGIQALFEERGRVLGSASKIAGSKVRAILDADARFLALLESEREATLSKLKRARQVSAARKLYTKIA